MLLFHKWPFTRPGMEPEVPHLKPYAKGLMYVAKAAKEWPAAEKFLFFRLSTQLSLCRVAADAGRSP